MCVSQSKQKEAYPRLYPIFVVATRAAELYDYINFTFLLNMKTSGGIIMDATNQGPTLSYADASTGIQKGSSSAILNGVRLVRWGIAIWVLGSIVRSFARFRLQNALLWDVDEAFSSIKLMLIGAYGLTLIGDAVAIVGVTNCARNSSTQNGSAFALAAGLLFGMAMVLTSLEWAGMSVGSSMIALAMECAGVICFVFYLQKLAIALKQRELVDRAASLKSRIIVLLALIILTIGLTLMVHAGVRSDLVLILTWMMPFVLLIGGIIVLFVFLRLLFRIEQIMKPSISRGDATAPSSAPAVPPPLPAQFPS